MRINIILNTSLDILASLKNGRRRKLFRKRETFVPVKATMGVDGYIHLLVRTSYIQLGVALPTSHLAEDIFDCH